jgi:hypothetical protein
MIPEELKSVFESDDFEDGHVQVRKLEIIEEDLEIEFEVDPGVGDESLLWKATGKDFVTFKLKHELCSSLILTQDHPLLWRYNTDHYHLYFTGDVLGSPMLFPMLSQYHRIELNDVIKQDEVINRFLLPELRPGKTSGLFAEGPYQIVQRYSKILKENEIECSAVLKGPPKYWDGEKQVEGKRSLFALLIDENQFIAKAFEFEQLGGDW